MGSCEPIKLLDHFESDQVYDFWLIRPEIIPIFRIIAFSISHPVSGIVDLKVERVCSLFWAFVIAVRPGEGLIVTKETITLAEFKKYAALQQLTASQ